VDFTLSKEQRHWRSVAREFARDVVEPVAAVLDAEPDPEKAFSWDIIEAASRCGLRQAPLPRTYGGHDTDHLCQVVMLEELAAVDMGVAVIFAGAWRTMKWLMVAGNDEQRDRWLKRVGANPQALLAAALTEPESGSDNMLGYRGIDGGMMMRAERKGDRWILNGTKRYITNGNRADVIIAFARTDPSRNILEGVTTFLVPAEAEGLRVSKVFDKSGERLANNAELVFADVEVPDADRFGEIGNGLSSFVRHQRSTSAYNAATVYGVAKAALARAFELTRGRQQGGKRIIEHQAVGTYLVDMFAALDVARTYAWRAAWAADNVEHFAPHLNVIPKVFAAEQSLQAVTKCMELFGGASIMRDVGVEKLLRDASVFLHSDGTNMILRERLANVFRSMDEQSFEAILNPG
jgi:acyl-CoA dehydrogenase